MKMNWLAAWKLTLSPSHKRRSRSFAPGTSSLITENLETRCLLSATAGLDLDHHEHEDGSEHGLDADGNEWHALPEATLDATTVGGGTNTGDSSPFAYSDTFLLHSNPGANHTIYLDFDGHTTSGTAWNNNFNGGADFVTPEYNPDGVAGFSNSELLAIQKIWQRVTEDFVPFDVNVTTEAPADVNDLVKSGSGDTRWGVRVAIGGSSHDWYGNGAGGVAYIGSFNWNTDTPTYVFPDQLGNGYEKYVAEAASHEAGHTLGLRHDGTSTQGYYSGHGSGETAWAPIMGVGYYNNLSQWSRGEYADADRQEDDLAILTSQNGFGYRADDYGDSNPSASAANLVTSTTIDAAGIIETSADVDVFSFTTGAGTVSIDVQEFEIGPNLDILAELYDSSGSLVTSANPADFLDAQLSASVSAGTYYLHVSGVGKGDPATIGYSDYGSLGQYSFTGTIVDPGSLATLSISDATAAENGGFIQFAVSLSEPSDGSVVISYETANGSASASSDFWGKTGTMTFNAGEQVRYITVDLIDDATFEGTENLFLNITSATNASITDGQGEGTIVDDDPEPLPTVSIGDASANEGKLNTKGKNRGTPQLTNMTFTVTLSAASSQTVTVNYSTADGTATLSGNDYQAANGSVTFNPGETSRTVTVTIVGDNDVEPDENFSVNLLSASGANIADASGTGTILDDDSSGGGGNGGGGNGGGGGKGKNKAAVVDDGEVAFPVKRNQSEGTDQLTSAHAQIEARSPETLLDSGTGDNNSRQPQKRSTEPAMERTDSDATTANDFAFANFTELSDSLSVI